jgi:hypothetical protein
MGGIMPERRRTAFADILRTQPEPLEDIPEPSRETTESAGVESDKDARTANPPRKNKAISADYTKLTAYIPRTLAAAVKMCMALDQTSDQSAYVEEAIAEWVASKGRKSVLEQCGYGRINR